MYGIYVQMACDIPVNNAVLYKEMFCAVQYFHVKE